MRGERGFECRDRRSRLACRMQRDGVYVREARVPRLQRRGAGKFSQCGVTSIQSRQDQAERVVEHGACRRAGETVTKQTLTIDVAADTAVHVSEIHIRRNEARL